MAATVCHPHASMMAMIENRRVMYLPLLAGLHAASACFACHAPAPLAYAPGLLHCPSRQDSNPNAIVTS